MLARSGPSTSASTTVRSVRVAADDDVPLPGLAPGSAVDGVPLAQGDTVLLSRQANAAENGPWCVGATAGGAARPAGYAEAVGALFYATAGAARAGALYVCTGCAPTILQPVRYPPPMRRGAEERDYASALGVTASVLAGADVAADAANRSYIRGLLLSVAVVAPAYAPDVAVTATAEWSGRLTLYSPTGTPPPLAQQRLLLGPVFAVGEELQVFNASAFPLAVVAQTPGAVDAAGNVFALGGELLGLGAQIVPGGAAIVKQVAAAPGDGRAVAVLVGALTS